MAKKICLVDTKNSKYIFCNNGNIIINDKLIGEGKLITPINQISLRNKALFCVGKEKYSTNNLKGCMIDD